MVTLSFIFKYFEKLLMFCYYLGMCNLDKMRTLYKILCEVQLYQKETYPLKTFPEFLSRLKSIKDLYTGILHHFIFVLNYLFILNSDEEAYQRSLKIEPREIT